MASFVMLYTKTNRVETIFTDGLLIIEEEPPTSVVEPGSEVGEVVGTGVVGPEVVGTGVVGPEVVGTGVEPKLKQ